MEMKIYFNAKFKSGASARPFAKIVFADMEKQNMFGSMCGDGESENAQRFAVFGFEYDKHISGYHRSACEEKVFFENISSVSKELKSAFEKSINDLNRSYRAFVVESTKRGISYDYSCQKEIYSKIQEIRENFNKMKDVVSHSSTIEYKEIQNCSGELLDRIIASVFSKEGEIVEVDGKRYCLKKDGKDEIKKIFEVVGFENTEVKSEEIVVEDDVKKVATKKMAFVVNDDNLFNFNKGEFYNIVSDNGDYVKLIDIFGEKRNIKKNRVEFVDVEEELVYE